MSNLTPFAERLRHLRSESKMTQHELAERSGVHRQTIARLELGTREPTWQTVQALARAIGVNCKAFETPPAEAEKPAPKKIQKRNQSGKPQ